MALAFKPHLVSVSTVSQTASGGIANNLTYADAVEVYGMVAAKDLAAAYESFGIESKQPHKFLCDIADSVYFTIGSRVVWDSRTFAVTTPVRISKHGLPTDHAAVMLEELDI